ncbi:ABC transporter ATP-binding protein [Nocardioidaceae bacterium]|nr:ABC transporter ATP-binding protein [Nocardioidaceae bacterium]
MSTNSAAGAPVIETQGLRKVFRTRRGRSVVAVDGLDLAVPAGGVHGFLGPNGSGKTTSIRMMLGLASVTDGTIRLFGEPVPRQLPTVMPRIGAVVEQPKFTPTFTGRRNLELLARTHGVDDRAVDRTLEQVGMSGRESERFKGYSLGMKQRLAIAATLLTEPDLLILDEPTNGLDPAGIREIRDLIRTLGEQGVTVLLSSHILAEVEQVCRTVTIIGRGRRLAEGSVAELVAGTRTTRLVVGDTEATARAAQLLGDSGHAVRREGEALLLDDVDPGEANRLLGEAGIWASELTPVRRDLEGVFLELTAGAGPGRPSPGMTGDPSRGADPSRPSGESR